MDLMRARVALRERTLLDVLDLAVRFCAEHARAYAKLSLVVLAPCVAVSWAAAEAGGWWWGWTATVALTALADAPFVALASRLVFESGVRTRTALTSTLRAFPGLAGARAVQALGLLVSAFFLLIPWLYIGPAHVFLVEVVLLERGRFVAAVERAQRIARARFGVALGAMVIVLVLRVGAALAADAAGRELLSGLLQVRPPPSVWEAGGSWLALLGWWTIVPLLATARFFAYLDVRTRSEGWDIQTRFAAIVSRAALPAEDRGAVS